MKRYGHILLCAAMILAMVGCEKSYLELPTDDTEQQLITFSTSVEATKATQADVDYLQAYGKFNIATFLTDDNNTRYYTDVVEYSGSVWTSGVNRYWPVDYNLNMFAYSPIEDFVDINNSEDYADYSLIYTCPMDIDDQVDLLAKTLTNQEYGTDGSVGLEFKHILSSIKFKVQFEDETNVTLNAVSINYIGIEKQRTYNFASEEWIVPADADAIYFTATDGSSTTLDVNEQKTTTDATNNPVIFDNINNQLMIIPQKISAEGSDPHFISIQISYTLNAAQGGTETSVITGVMPLPAPTSDNYYSQGYVYTYGVIVNSEQISFGDITITDQEDPVAAYGNIDLGLITTSMTYSDYEIAVGIATDEASATKATDDGEKHLYYSTAVRAYQLLADGVRDFVVVGSYGADDGGHDGKLGYSGSESSPFFIAAESLGMMPEYDDITDEQGNQTKEFGQILNNDGSYSIVGLNTDYLFSLDLRGVYDFPTFEELHSDSGITSGSSVLDGTAPVIPKYAFRDIALLDEVIFPHGLSAIGDYAFENCVMLREVDLAGVMHIEPGGFDDCINLQTVKGDAGALTRIHENAFDECYNLETIDLKNVTEIGDYAFVNCYKLTNVDLSSLTVVGQSAFDECYELTLSPDMSPKTLKLSEVEKYAFSGCSKFVAQIDLTTATYVNEHAFNDCTEITFSAGNLDELVTIGNNAFADCAHIGSSGIEITMPKIETIGAYAFKGCTYLNIVEGLDNLDEITTSVFQGCTSLTGYSSTASESEKILSLPLVTAVGYGGFQETAITNVSFLNESGESDKLTTIGEFAFDNCVNLTTISGLDNVTSIGKYAFNSCSSLEKLELPNLQDGEWGRHFFSGCTSLKILSLPQLTVNSITEDYSTYYSITDMINYSTSEEINLPALIFEVPGWGKFQANSSLKIANFASATSVGNGAFFGCTALEIVDLSSATTIGEQAFKGCEKLQILELPLATSIGNSAFYGCIALETINLSSATTIGDQAFNGCEKLQILELPLATSVGANALSGCLSLETLISSKYLGSSSGVIGGDAGTSIGGWGAGNGYFYENFPNLIYVDFASVETINAGAFINHSKVEAIDLRSATTVGGNAFQNCTSLKRLNLSGLTDSDNIGDWAFSGIADDQCEIWLSSDQAETADGTTWQEVTWQAIHSVDSEGNYATPFALISESEN